MIDPSRYCVSACRSRVERGVSSSSDPPSLCEQQVGLADELELALEFEEVADERRRLAVVTSLSSCSLVSGVASELVEMQLSRDEMQASRIEWMSC